VQTGPRLGVKPIVPVPVAAPAAPGALFLHSRQVPGAVSTQPAVYLVFWGAQWSSDPAGVAPALQAFFRGLFGRRDRWGTVLDQYCEGQPVGATRCPRSSSRIRHPTTSPLAGVWFDNAANEPRHATMDQIASEAVRAAQHFGNVTQADNAQAQYVIASPSGTHPDGFPSFFCGWHSSARGSVGTVAYTNMPYLPDLGAGGCTTIRNPTLLDGYFSTESHEYAESVTDLWPEAGWLDAGGQEIADLCVDLDARQRLTTGTFDVQGIWSNKAGRCVTS
jgi:serine protease